MPAARMDPRALKLIFRENAPSRLKAQRLEKKVDKIWTNEVTKDAVCRLFHKKEGYHVWAYRIFAASVLLGDYDWWGWECRSGWAWKSRAREPPRSGPKRSRRRFP